MNFILPIYIRCCSHPSWGLLVSSCDRATLTSSEEDVVSVSGVTNNSAKSKFDASGGGNPPHHQRNYGRQRNVFWGDPDWSNQNFLGGVWHNMRVECHLRQQMNFVGALGAVFCHCWGWEAGQCCKSLVHCSRNLNCSAAVLIQYMMGIKVKPQDKQQTESPDRIQRGHAGRKNLKKYHCASASLNYSLWVRRKFSKAASAMMTTTLAEGWQKCRSSFLSKTMATHHIIFLSGSILCICRCHIL